MAAKLISCVKVQTVGGHDLVKIWSRGGLAGELTVTKGDGAFIADRLFPGESTISFEDSTRVWRPGYEPVDSFKDSGELCSICREPQYLTLSVPVCKNGHGGAPPL